MINILLEGYNIDAPWLYNELKKYIQPNHSVAVVALSFRENRVKSLSDWNALYNKKFGKFYNGIVGGFAAYGILEENIVFINYFTDTNQAPPSLGFSRLEHWSGLPFPSPMHESEK